MAEIKKEPEICALEVPEYMKPKDLDSPEVEATKIMSLPASDAKAISSSLKRLGMKKVTAKQVSELSALGVMFPPASIIRLATGGSVVTQFGLMTAYQEVLRIFSESNDRAKLKIVAQIGFLAKQLTGNQKSMSESARKNMPRPVDESANIRAHRFPVMQFVFQNADGQTVVKAQEKTVTAQASEVK